MDYDVQRISDVIATFKQRPKDIPVNVIFDSDNTIYQFSTYHQLDLATRQMYTKGFFKELPIFPEAPIVLETLQRMGFRVGILTAAVDSPFCKAEKLESIHYHFPQIPDNMIMITEPGESKVNRIWDPSNTIVVDDYGKNIREFYDNGIVGIKKSYSGKPRPVPIITNLIEIFAVLKELNVY